jgi:hypothetical protein
MPVHEQLKPCHLSAQGFTLGMEKFQGTVAPSLCHRQPSPLVELYKSCNALNSLLDSIPQTGEGEDDKYGWNLLIDHCGLATGIVTDKDFLTQNMSVIGMKMMKSL